MEKTSNPSMSAKVLARASEFVGEDTGVMTVSGAINKSGILFLILCAAGAFGWSYASTPLAMPMVLGGTILGLIAAIVLMFSPQRAPMLAPAYAVFEGLAIGVITAFYDQRFPGIATNAMVLTFGTLGLMLGCYRLGILRATERFTRILVLATMAVGVCYLVDIIMMMFGQPISFIHQGTGAGIAFSLIVTGIAAFNLILDFNQIEQAAYRRMPKFMEWYTGFSLLVTLVWLYLEILRLLGKMNRR